MKPNFRNTHERIKFGRIICLKYFCLSNTCSVIDDDDVSLGNRTFSVISKYSFYTISKKPFRYRMSTSVPILYNYLFFTFKTVLFAVVSPIMYLHTIDLKYVLLYF